MGSDLSLGLDRAVKDWDEGLGSGITRPTGFAPPALPQLLTRETKPGRLTLRGAGLVALAAPSYDLPGD